MEGIVRTATAVEAGLLRSFGLSMMLAGRIMFVPADSPGAALAALGGRGNTGHAPTAARMSLPACAGIWLADTWTLHCGVGYEDHERAQGWDGAAWQRTLGVHFKLFGTDGVSLQSQGLSKALGAPGWQVLPAPCDVPTHIEGLRLPELSYQSSDAIALQERILPSRCEVPRRRRMASISSARSNAPKSSGGKSRTMSTRTRSRCFTSAT